MVLRSSILASIISAAFVVSMGACSGPSEQTPDVHDANASTEAGDTRTTSDVAVDSISTDTGAPDSAAADVIVDDGGDDVGSVDAVTPMDVVSSMDSATDTGPGEPDVVLPDVVIPDVVIPDVVPETGGPACSPGQHVCVCATGTYCLNVGFMCLNPSAPCPM